MKNLNVNESVIVKLNECGKVAWEKHANDVSKKFVKDPVLFDTQYTRVMKKLKDDTLEAPLWEVMIAFGKYMEEESKYPFKSDIKIKEKSLY